MIFDFYVYPHPTLPDVKTSPILLTAQKITRELWRKACISEGIPTNSMFVVFSKKHAALNRAAAQRYEVEDMTEAVGFIGNDTPSEPDEPGEPNEPLPEPTSEPLPAPQAGPLFLLRSGRRFFYDAKGPQLLFTHDLKLAKKVTAEEGRAMEYVIEVYHGRAIDLVPMEALS